MFVFVCRQGPELRNQVTEGDPGRRAEGQHGLWDIYQGEDAVILHSAVNCTFIKTINFVLQDYESDLAAYTSGLETLLNIPIKRTMLKSPTVDLNQEVSDWKEQQTIFACRSSYFLCFAVSGYTTADALHGAAHHVCRLLQVPGRPAQKHGGAEGTTEVFS